MARIRTIKPEFFRHEALYEAECLTRLPLRIAFAGLWTVADREGRFRWQPRVLKLDVLPFDECNFGDVLDALAQSGFVVCYEVDGQLYGQIPSWRKHQQVNVREQQSSIPAPDSSSAIPLPPSPKHVHAHDKSSGEGKGREGERKGKGTDKDSTLGEAELVSLGVDRQHAKDWLKARKAKRLPLTRTALEDVKAEAEKANLTLADAVKLAATHGWAGFKAKWLTESGGDTYDPAAVAAEAMRLMDEREREEHATH